MSNRHCGYIIQVKELVPHKNADKLQLLRAFGTETCVPLDVKVGDVGVYFPVDLQLSEEFCIANDLLERKDENGEKVGKGYLHPIKRNVKCIKLRGEKSDGMYLPISCFDYLNLTEPLKPGDTIDVLEGHEICCKYIPRSNKVRTTETNNKKNKKINYAPLFKEHVDTEQLAYNLADFRPGDYVEITLKLHGTSQRTGYLPVLKGYKLSLLDRIKSIFNKEKQYGKPIYEYGYVTGTRRVVIEDFDKPSYYDSNDFREEHAKAFEGKLYKNETAYYEIVGFQKNSIPIMASCDNKKTKDKDFIKQYGPTTTFSYGCEPFGFKVIPADPKIPTTTPKVDYTTPQSDMYVYRMTMTNEDGDVVEYTPDFMRYRCKQMGIKTVPVLWSGIIPEDLKTEDFFAYEDGSFIDWVYADTPGEWVQNKAEQYYDGPDPIGKTHIREGVVVRIINRPNFKAYKHKNFDFKVLENIIKIDAEAPDMEEVQEL